MYKILLCDRIIKEYPLKAQAVMWCWLNRYVINNYRYGFGLDSRIKIVKGGENATKTNMAKQ